ncbi:26840_t:CDS:1, partial [Gigaspora margarita]
DSVVKGKKISDLSNCSECEKEIISHPLKAFTTLSCGHAFHRLCIEKKLLLTMPNICPFPGCSEEVEIIETGGRRGSESSTSSVVRRMEKHSIQSQDMPEIPEEDMPDVVNREGEDNRPLDKSNIPSGEETCKRPSEDTSENKLSSKKLRKEGEKKESSMLEKIIKELSTDTSGISEVSEEIDVGSSNFLQLSNKIDHAESKNEDATRELIKSYFNFGEAIYNRYKELKATYGKDGASALVNDEVRNEIPKIKFTDDALRKRRERAEKVYKLFTAIGGKTKISRIKSFPARSILNLSKENVNHIIVG